MINSLFILLTKIIVKIGKAGYKTIGKYVSLKMVRVSISDFR